MRSVVLRRARATLCELSARPSWPEGPARCRDARRPLASSSTVAPVLSGAERFLLRTPESMRAAILEYEGMERSTLALLKHESWSPASIQQLRTIFHFWVGRRCHTVDDTMDDPKATAYAEAIFNLLRNKINDVDILQSVYRNDESAAGALIHLAEMYLTPFKGTHQSLMVSKRRLRSYPKLKNMESLLVKASRIAEYFHSLVEDPAYSRIRPDRYTCNMVLGLWTKRCWFLSQFLDDPDFEVDTAALGGAATVEECLASIQEFLELMLRDPNYPQPTIDSYMLVLTAWVNSGLPTRADEADRLLQVMNQDPALRCMPGYNAVIYAHASQAADSKHHVVRASELLAEMQTYGIQPEPSTYATMLLAYTNANELKMAEELLARMETGEDRISVLPNTICYNTVLDCMAKSNDPGSPRCAEALIERMHYLEDSGLNPDAAPDYCSYTAAIDAWSRSSHREGADEAERLLFRCIELARSNPTLLPDSIIFNVALDARVRRSGRPDKEPDETEAHRAEALLRRMHDFNIEFPRRAPPDIVTYNAVLNVWAKTGSHQVAGERARSMLKEMKEAYHAGNVDMKPDIISYNVVIGLVARSGTDGCIQEAFDLLTEMESLGFRADIISFNTLVNAIVKSDKEDVTERAEEVLQMLEDYYLQGNNNMRPNEITYNTVLNGYARMKDPDAGAKAEKVLERMIALSKEPGREDLTPSRISFTTVIGAYAKAGQIDRAEAVLQKMIDCSIVPSAVTYNALINAFAQSDADDAPARAEQLLTQMQEEYEKGNELMKPNTIGFSTVINCLARSRIKGSAERAEAILTRMEQLSESGQKHLQPNVFTYGAVLNAYARSRQHGSTDRAILLLHRMENAYREGKSKVRVNAHCYNSVINAIAKSPSPTKATDAYNMLQRMVQAYEDGNRDAKPSVFTYATVLNACAYTPGTASEMSEAFRIASVTFGQLTTSKYDKPNEASYVGFFTACIRLLPPGESRDKLVVSIIRECSQSCGVPQKLVDQFETVVDPAVFQKHKSLLNRKSREPVGRPTYTPKRASNYKP